MDRSYQRGSAIIMLFIAVALFGLLAYAFLQGSRSNLNMLTSEASKTAGIQTQDCTNAVNMALSRLKARGCGTMISSASDGSNAAPGAPTDGSCSVYHPNGGGVKASCITTPTCDITTLAIGAECGGFVYAGISSGNRIYTTRTDLGKATWNNGSMAYIGTAASSATNGRTNTDLLVGLVNANAPYAAAQACRALGPLWYLPSKDELHLFYTNKVALQNFNEGGTLGDFYYSSTDYGNGIHIWTESFDSSSQSGINRHYNLRVRCAYRP